MQPPVRVQVGAPPLNLTGGALRRRWLRAGICTAQTTAHKAIT